jgi:transcriptional regulator with XRE-family HTH domain
MEACQPPSVFSTVIGFVEPSPSTAQPEDELVQIQYLLSQAKHRLQILAKTEVGQSATYREIASELTALLEKLVGQKTSLEYSRLAALIRQRREEALLSQADLAEKAGLSRALLIKIESGKRRLTAKSLRAFLKVPELRLETEAMLLPTPGADREPLNWFVPHSFDGVAMLDDLKRRLQRGCSLEQTYAYLDHQSAADYCKDINDPAYGALYRQSIPTQEIASQILEHHGEHPMDLIALGPGDGGLEISLVQSLIGIKPEADFDIRFYLLDISQPLLSRAHRNAKDKLEQNKRVVVVAMQGNFHQLPYFEQIFYSPSRRNRVFTMVGGTFGNLEDEIRFLTSALSIARKGDLLVFDFLLAHAQADDEANIRAIDPVFRSKPRENAVRFLTGPFRRYTSYRSIELKYDLRLELPVPGSYEIDVTVLADRERFSVFRFRRYDPASLRASLSRVGWNTIYCNTFGKDAKNGVLVLCKR